ncbi:hypothetical protein [Geopseudomonas aromaticivorans]
MKRILVMVLAVLLASPSFAAKMKYKEWLKENPGGTNQQYQDWKAAGNTTTATDVVASDVVMEAETVIEKSSCVSDGQILFDATGRILTCQNGEWAKQFSMSEEMHAIIGCNDGTGFCTIPNYVGAPAGTVYNYDAALQSNQLIAPIGPRAFCGLGFVAMDPRPGVGNGAESPGDMCKVYPSGTDAETGKPIWYILAGSKSFYVGCHAVCIK